MLAAVLGAAVTLPGPLHVTFIVLVAAVVGALWAGIAGALKVYRGVSEVISTIMLNFIGGALVAWMLTPAVFATLENNIVRTSEIPSSGWFPGFSFGEENGTVYGFIVVSGLVGVAYWFVLNRTRFGFDLRATGHSETAAVASGVSVKRMVLVTMLLSGAVAGLIGLPQLFGASHAFGSTIQTGIGFTGIAVALLGRNSPWGIALGALIFAFLTQQASPLGITAGISNEIIAVTQGVVVLSVVIAYEVVRRYRVRAEQREVAAALQRARAEDRGVPV
jgi:simple sugar transport system permease protein